MIGSDLQIGDPLELDIASHLVPSISESIVFYLGSPQESELHPSIGSVNWRYLLYEFKSEDKRDAEIQQIVKLKRPGICRVIATSHKNSVDNPSRTLLLFERVTASAAGEGK